MKTCENNACLLCPVVLYCPQSVVRDAYGLNENHSQWQNSENNACLLWPAVIPWSVERRIRQMRMIINTDTNENHSHSGYYRLCVGRSRATIGCGVWKPWPASVNHCGPLGKSGPLAKSDVLWHSATLHWYFIGTLLWTSGKR